jgi:hypothetical protein
MSKRLFIVAKIAKAFDPARGLIKDPGLDKY